MIKRKELCKEIPQLTVAHDIRIRFNETDPLGIVWHGYYITYFEDGREAFGRQHGISYLDVQANGYTTPIVKSSCEHKLSLRYGDVARIETTFVDTPAAKMIFRYKIFDNNNNIVCTGETVQVFLDANGDLSLSLPAFFKEWKRKCGLIE
ncbi:MULTISPECIES: acyl-CoA thioesterase [Flavobacterium]|uniref:Acyl-CoA thioesterase n=1 Tax=Flavobacterium columnare TaxID=996 RepID=A0AA94F392_9FLAO|nr:MULTISPECIES: acyl-CoA thioesterase [Flavobacterium]OXA81529.1 4-hydroxybenzoyl-CoA thioesterase [Flavobacterium columnare NBRC 100251 = ATCC 23463]AMA48512.1 4-hydroxybenzoyl-CoA thioesterase [Flavobacterium covae]AND65360.1 4-hydroxybenzoyl-CoA thioesterase [Flavobacterium covae]MCH4830461.1 acyl-CoA thioesterase [Flavobacterium columnare]MCH4833603.1 acyl-CoA thioesterase [Flavobacterium columnare]